MSDLAGWRQNRVFRGVWTFGVLVVLALGTAGCSDLKPWVKPYERDNLADPIMSLSRHGYADSYMHHVYQARESSRGSEGGAGGGCGCN